MGLDQYAYTKTAESGEEGESPKFVWRKHSKRHRKLNLTGTMSFPHPEAILL